jgi:hypothetical protein
MKAWSIMGVWYVRSMTTSAPAKARSTSPPADVQFRQQVAGGVVFVDARGLRAAGLEDVRHHGQRFVLHPDALQGLPGHFRALRRHQRHRVPHVADLVGAEDGPVPVDQPVAVLAGDVLPGEDGVDAGERAGFGDVYPADVGVGDPGPQDGAVEHAGEGQVVGVAGGAGHFGDGVGAGEGTAHRAPRAGGWRG